MSDDAGAGAVRVRVMQPDEYERVRALEVAAFGDDRSIGELLDLLRGSWTWEDELSFVAEREGEIVAHVLYTHAIVDAPLRLVDVLLLSPVGVRPDLHGAGIGTCLITESLDALARTRTEPMVFLEGNPRFYSRFGFVRADERGFTAPSTRIPPPAFQVLSLPGDDRSITGALVYPDAFWRTDAVGLR
jgi:putative acetyltransferase